MEDFHVIVDNSLHISVLVEQPTLQLALCQCIPYIYHRSARQGQHDESFSCILCNEEFNISQEDLENHCEKAEHVKRLGELKVHLERIKEMSRRFHYMHSPECKEDERVLERIEQLPCQTWKNAVNAKMFHYLVASDAPSFDLIQLPSRDLSVYEHYHRLTMLHLAVWKAICLLQMPRKTAGFDFYEAQEWMKSGWKACKAEQRSSNAMSIVVQAVCPFLEERRSYCWWPVS